MKIYVDADACPVQQEVIIVAKEQLLPVYLVKSFSHFSHNQLPDHVETIYVDPGADVADYKIVGLVDKGDIVITQDYGLASLCLNKGCTVLHHKGFLFTENNIDRLLQSRHTSAMARRAGQRTKGPRPFTEEDRENFSKQLKNIIMQLKGQY